MEKSPQVDNYINSLPESCRQLIGEIRTNVFEILSDVGGMEEVYSYKIAVYKYNGKPLFSVAGFKDHCSLITQDKEIASKIPELKKFNISGTSIHFSSDKQISKDLLSEILKTRIASRRK